MVLSGHIATEVAKLAGVELGTPRRKILWGSVIWAAIIGSGLGYLTYVLTEDGFVWYSVFPAIGAGLMALAIMGLLMPDREPPPPGDEQLVIDSAEDDQSH